MAGKDTPSIPSDRRNTVSTDTDFDFDFDDEFGSLEGQSAAFESSVKSQKTQSKAREAVTDTFKGAISGAKDSVFSEKNLRTLVTSSLPDEYETIFTRTGEVAGQVSGVYNEAVKELRPTAKRFSKILDKMSKDEDSISRKLSSKVKDVFGIYDTPKISEAQQQEQTITAELGNIFNTSLEAQSQLQADLQARQESQQNLDRQVEAKRFKTQFSSLVNIDRSTATLAQYQTQITAGYQKKSLELQYRMFFAMSELVQKSKEFFEVSKAQQTDIVKNTALPEYVKLQQSEFFAQHLRNKIAEGIGKKLFSPQGVLEKGFGNIKKIMKEKLTNLQMAFGQGFDMVESLQQNKEMMDGMNGIEGFDLGGAGSTANMVGNVATSVALEGPLEKLMKKAGSYTRKNFVPKDGKIDKFGKQAFGYANNPQAFARDIMDSKFVKENEHLPGMDLFKEVVKGFATDKPASAIESLYGNNKSTNPDVSFDRRFYASVTDVIPGYLARILVENKKLVSTQPGKPGKIDTTRFDFNQGKFIDEKVLKTDIKSHFEEIGKQSGAATDLDNFIKVAGLDKSLDDKSKLALKEALLRWILSGEAVTLKAMSDPNFIRLIDKKYRKKIVYKLEGLSSNIDALAPGDKQLSIKSAFDIHGGKIKNSLPNLTAEAQSFESAGSGDLLESLGITSRGKNGKSTPSVSHDAYVDSILKSDIHAKEKIKPYQVTSDIHAKEKIKPTSNGSVLDQILKTDNYRWKYKQGQGDGKYHFGPMAKPIQTNFGNQAAPGGTSIDLVTMNGYNMQGIKDLNTKVDTMIGTDKNTDTLLDTMRLVETNTLRTATAVEGLSNQFFLGLPNFDLSKGKEKLGLFARLFKDKSKEVLSEGKDKLQQAGKEASKQLDNAKDAMTMGPFQPEDTRLSKRLFDFANSPSESITGAVSRVAAFVSGAGVKVAEKSMDTLSGTFDFTKKNIVDPTWNFGKDMLKDNKDKIKSSLEKLMSGAWNLASNIYDGTLNLVKNQIPQGLRGIWDNIKKVGEFAASVLDEPIDIYVIGEPEPRIKAQLMRLGGYIDTNTKKIITRPGMISGPVSTLDGNIVLSTEDLTKGIIDKEGNPIESLKWRITRYLKDRAINTINTVKDAWKKLSGKGRDLFDAGREKLKNASIGIRGYDRRIYNVLLDIRDISLAAINKGKAGKMTLRSLADEKAEKEKVRSTTLPNQTKSSTEPKEQKEENIEKEEDNKPKSKLSGLLDRFKNNEKVKELKAKIPNKSKLLEKLNQFKDSKKVQELKDKIPDKVKLSGLLDKFKDSEKVKELKTKLPDKSKLKELFGKIKDKEKIQEIKSKVLDKTKLEGFKERFKKKADEANEKRKEIQEKLKAKVETRYKGNNILDNLGGKLSTVAGLLGFGKKKKPKETEENKDKPKSEETKQEKPSEEKKTRMGSWKDRIKNQLTNANEKRKEIQEKLKAKVETRYKGKNVFDMIGEKLAAVKNFFSSAIDDVMSIAGGKGGLLSKVGKIGGKVAGGLLRGGGAVLAGAGSLLGKTTGALSKTIGAGARMLPGGLMGNVAKGALHVGRLGLSAAGLLGEGALAAAGGIASSIATSPALPFIAGAVAIGAIGYGLYKGYKYLTKDNVSEVDKIRIMEYGLNSEQSKFNHYLLGLENMVEQKAQLIINGSVKVDPSKLKWEDVFDMMDIKLNTDQGKEQASRFNEWFYARFIPVYIQNRSALFSADPKLKMSEISKLAGDTLSTYLVKCDAPNSIYSVTVSPFPGLDKLSTTKEEVQTLIKKLKEQATKDSKDPKKQPTAKQTDVKTAEGMEKANKDLSTQVKNDTAQAIAAGSAIDKTLNNAKDGGANTSISGTSTSNTNGSSDLQKNPQNKSTNSSITNSTSSVEDQPVVPGSMNKLNSIDSENYKSLDGIKKMIDEASKVAGVDPGMMKTMAAIESNFNPSAQAGQNGAAKTSAAGLYQFINSTWHAMLMKYGSKYGLGMGASKFDPKANTLMAAEYIKENMKVLKSVVPQITAEHVYGAHFLGPGGAKLLYGSPDNQPASQVLPQAAKSNASIFFNNGIAKTIGEVKQWIRNRIAAVNKRYGIEGKLTEIATLGQSDSKGQNKPMDTIESTPPSSSTSLASKQNTIDSVPKQNNTQQPVSKSSPETYAQTPTDPSIKKTGFGASAFDNPVNARQAATQYPQDTGMSKTPAAFGVPNSQTIRTPQPMPVTTAQTASVNQNNSISSDGKISDVLTKSLDVQTKLYEVVLEMSKKMSPEAMSNLLNQLNPSKPQSSTKPMLKTNSKEGFPTLPINLERASL